MQYLYLEIHFLHKLACFLHISGISAFFILASLENLIWSFIKSPSLSTIINPFCNFLFLLFSFLTDLQLYSYFHLPPTFHTRFSSVQILVIDLSLFLLRPILLAFRIFIYPAFISWYGPFSFNCIQLATSLDIFLSFQLFVLFSTHKCMYNFNSDLLSSFYASHKLQSYSS